MQVGHHFQQKSFGHGLQVTVHYSTIFRSEWPFAGPSTNSSANLPPSLPPSSTQSQHPVKPPTSFWQCSTVRSCGLQNKIITRAPCPCFAWLHESKVLSTCRHVATHLCILHAVLKLPGNPTFCSPSYTSFNCDMRVVEYIGACFVAGGLTHIWCATISSASAQVVCIEIM